MIKIICKYLWREKQPFIITIIGAIGTGKTTLTEIIHKYCFPNYHRFDLTDLSQINEIPRYNLDKIYIVFDDFSYKLVPRTREEREKLTELFRIRHKLGTNNVIIVFVVHYMRSISVFLRNSQVRILTSITEPEIKMYANDYLFIPSDLWDYLYYRTKYPDLYIVLYHGLMTGEHIIDVTIKEPLEPQKSRRKPREQQPLEDYEILERRNPKLI